MITTLRNRKADAYAIAQAVQAVQPRYYAFLDPDDLVACIYAADGTWIADRGAIPRPAVLPSGENGILIPTDAIVGPGAIAWRSADNELTVWDVDSAHLYTYQATPAAYCSPPVHHAGRLWWVEFPAHEDEPNTNRATLTLRSAACDLTDPQTVAAVVFSAFLASWDLGPEAKVAASETGLLFESIWVDNLNHEVADAAGAHFPFGQGDPEAQDGARIDLGRGLPASDGTSVGLAVPANTLRALPSTLGHPSTPRWPTTGSWALAEGFGLAFNAALSADGATALLYGYPPEGETPVVIEAPSTATTGQPTALVPVAPNPVRGDPPILLFFMPTAAVGAGLVPAPLLSALMSPEAIPGKDTTS
ncbi:MAG TPA: hypothetical protein VN493_30990 [Thermoanaerobaculia bacterium]|nr:hypothetical protein [Thermoanaerobaculia bacterium]